VLEALNVTRATALAVGPTGAGLAMTWARLVGGDLAESEIMRFEMPRSIRPTYGGAEQEPDQDGQAEDTNQRDGLCDGTPQGRRCSQDCKRVIHVGDRTPFVFSRISDSVSRGGRGERRDAVPCVPIR